MDVYSSTARAYAERFYNELIHKPLDCWLLDRFVAKLPPGPVGDLGCGPGQIAHALRLRGVESLFGLDLAHGMVRTARELAPTLPCVQANLRSLPAPTGGWAGIAAFYAIVNLPPLALPFVIAEMARVLAPGGELLLSFHVGDECVRVDQFLGATQPLDFYFFPFQRVLKLVTSAGFTIDEALVREPYTPHEHSSQRGYLLARRNPL